LPGEALELTANIQLYPLITLTIARLNPVLPEVVSIIVLPATIQLPSALANMTTVQEVHEYYQKIIGCMPNNVYWLDRNGITQGCNANVLKFLGLKNQNDFVGLTYEKMGEIAHWTEGHAEIYKRDDMAVMSSGAAKLNIEDPPLHDKDGQAIYYLSSRVPALVIVSPVAA